MSFSVGKDAHFYINAIAQYSWDGAKKRGSFSENKENPSKNIVVKFNEFECGEMIYTLENGKECSFFHKDDRNNNQTQIRLKKWLDKNSGEYRGWGISLTRNGVDKFQLPVTIGEAEVFKQTLLSCIKRKIAKKDDAKEKNSSS